MTGAHNFIQLHADEQTALGQFRGVAMRTIKTTNGAEIQLDGDILTVMETLYHEVTARRELERSFEDMVREIQPLIDQMDRGRARRPTCRRACSSTRSPTRTNASAPTCGSWPSDQPTSPQGRPMSLNFLATRFTCSWPWEHPRHALRRPHRLRLRRSVRDGACSATRARRLVHDIWTGPTIAGAARRPQRRRIDVLRRLPAEAAAGEGRGAAAARPRRGAAARSRLYIECTAACNISCFQACCAPETGITRTRQAGMLDFDLFTRVIDEAGPSLGRVDFFNYGEAFLHKRAVEMCEYIKATFPHIYLYTSTNGLALKDDGRAAPRAHRGSTR